MAFPLATKQDASKFNIDYEDTGIRSEMEGGYVLTRPRHTRGPRRTWTTGFTGLTQTDFATFETFWKTNGTFTLFTYTVPVTNETVTVRFASKPEMKYVGIGTSYLWDITVKLEEA